ncbi:MAG: hypothetical protein VKO00_11005 [Cyanobacteriota bacterium]|nr:hypothetical protein [Cyanobacteriota bacterium]
MTASSPDHPPSRPSGDRVFNNADSFAQAFDIAWQQRTSLNAGNLGKPEQLEQILDDLADHPFCLENRELARKVGEFRIRLLGL